MRCDTPKLSHTRPVQSDHSSKQAIIFTHLGVYFPLDLLRRGLLHGGRENQRQEEQCMYRAKTGAKWRDPGYVGSQNISTMPLRSARSNSHRLSAFTAVHYSQTTQSPLPLASGWTPLSCAKKGEVEREQAGGKRFCEKEREITERTPCNVCLASLALGCRC